MSRRLRLTFLIAIGLLLLLAAVLLGVYLALQYEPAFYHKALEIDSAVQEKASDEMLQRLTGLVSDVGKPGKWQALFSAEQINGWLAVDMVNNHPHTLPPFFRDPRVAINSEQIVLACRYQRGILSTVLTLTVMPYMPEENMLALRIISVQAGLVPLPLGKVLDGITEAAKRSEWQIQWRQTSGDPVAGLSIPPPKNARDLVVKIETIQLQQDKIFVSGVSQKQK